MLTIKTRLRVLAALGATLWAAWLLGWPGGVAALDTAQQTARPGVAADAQEEPPATWLAALLRAGLAR